MIRRIRPRRFRAFESNDSREDLALRISKLLAEANVIVEGLRDFLPGLP